LTLINLFFIPTRAVDEFVAGWPNSTARLADASGFRGARLHRAVSPNSSYQIVNVARWDSFEQWQAALSGFRPESGRQRPSETNGIAVQPAFYTVVSAISAPNALSAQGWLYAHSAPPHELKLWVHSKMNYGDCSAR